MKRTLISLNIAAALLLTACGTHPPAVHKTAARPAIHTKPPPTNSSCLNAAMPPR